MLQSRLIKDADLNTTAARHTAGKIIIILIIITTNF
jgi:hypothetical protein